MPQLDEPLTITLSLEDSRLVRERIAENGYRDAEDVIHDALSAFEPDESEIEQWLRKEVIPTCEELDRDPTQVVTLEELDRHIAELHAKTVAEHNAR